MFSVVATLPWVLLVVSLPFMLRRHPRLRDYPSRGGGGPRVSVIVPTRNDADRVGVCLATLMDSQYEDFEILVVDQASTDGTREIVEALRARAAHSLRLVDAGPVPEGWPVRAWSCRRGAQEADGTLLLFTEPGTVHGSDVLPRAVTVLEAESADVVTVRPELSMHGFWERLVMPHVWLVLAARFPSASVVNRARSPRSAMGHHQFFLFVREAYEEIGGHSVVRLGGVEDLALPQAVVSAGLRLFLVHGASSLETRMVRTFDEMASDWTGAVPPASRSTVAPWAGIFVPWLVTLAPLVFFALPPLALLATAILPGVSAATPWALATTALALTFWLAVYTRFRIRPAYAVAYSVGAMVTAWIFLKSILRRDRAT
jgi:cellulose synthase/poly-beta-1,6-N-acetylglucosamine synthase-like glycosyltransferase